MPKGLPHNHELDAQVIALRAEGKTNQQIAEETKYSLTHIKHLVSQLNLPRRSGAKAKPDPTEPEPTTDPTEPEPTPKRKGTGIKISPAMMGNQPKGPTVVDTDRIELYRKMKAMRDKAFLRMYG